MNFMKILIAFIEAGEFSLSKILKIFLKYFFEFLYSNLFIDSANLVIARSVTINDDS